MLGSILLLVVVVHGRFLWFGSFGLLDDLFNGLGTEKAGKIHMRRVSIPGSIRIQTKLAHDLWRKEKKGERKVHTQLVHPPPSLVVVVAASLAPALLVVLVFAD